MRGFILPALALSFAAAPAAFAETIRLDVVRAEPQFDADARPVVAIALSQESARAVGRFTAARVGETIHLKAAGKIVSSPRIMSPIPGRWLQISGMESVAAAQELAVRIRDGSASIELEGSDKAP